MRESRERRKGKIQAIRAWWTLFFGSGLLFFFLINWLVGSCWREQSGHYPWAGWSVEATWSNFSCLWMPPLKSELRSMRGQSSSEWHHLQPPPVPSAGWGLICATLSLSDSVLFCPLPAPWWGGLRRGSWRLLHLEKCEASVNRLKNGVVG